MEARSFRFAAAALLIAARAGMAYAADAVAPAGSAPPAAYTVAPSGPDMVTLNFVNADIEGVVKAVGEITGKNFVIDPRVKGTINIISSQPMSRALVYEVFLAALRLQGFAAVEDRGLVKILPEADAKLHRGSAQRGVGDEIQTRIFNLKYESAAQMVTILRPLISPNNSITPAQSSNSLIITDYAGNLERIARIIGGLDRPTGTDPIDIPLHNASALDVAATINRLFAEAGAPAAAEPALHFVIIPDARSNSILVRSADPSRLAQIRQLADMLDSRTSAGGNIHVVYLKNAEAVKIAETLRAIYSGEGGALRPVQSAPLPALGASAMAAAAPVPGQSTQGMGAQAALPAQPAAAGVGTPGIIQADAATNSIIITAPDAVYNNLRAALEKLDVRRAQVYVEAMIAEITSDKAAEFGIQWQDLNGTGGTTASAFGGTNFGTTGQNILGIAANPTTAGAGLNVGIIKGTVSIGGVQLLNLGVLVRALESNNNANILSTPTLLTLDNEEARIVIGQNVPFITGQYAISGAATTPTPFQTIERRDVGLTLRIKPQVSEGGAVRLQIYQEVSSIADSTNPAGVITNMRSVASTVMVDDGQIVVIGGLMQDSVADTVQKVPGLGDVPVLGNLFKYNTRSRSKTNLMVFLRPTVLRNEQRADSLTTDRYDFIRGVQQDSGMDHSKLLPNYPPPTLPLRPATSLGTVPAEPAAPDAASAHPLAPGAAPDKPASSVPAQINPVSPGASRNRAAAPDPPPAHLVSPDPASGRGRPPDPELP